MGPPDGGPAPTKARTRSASTTRTTAAQQEPRPNVHRPTAPRARQIRRPDKPRSGASGDTPRAAASSSTAVVDAEGSRGRRARRAAVLGVVYQGVFAVIQLICLGVLARHVPRDVFGLWMTVMAVASWAPMAYFGQPAALLTRLGAIAHTDTAAGGRLFVAASVITLGMTALLLAILLGATPWLSWPAILNANTAATEILAQRTALLAIGVALLANPATISNFALMAHQRGDVAHAAMIVASLVGLLLFVTGVWAGQPLPITGALMLCGPLLGGLALWLTVASQQLIPLPSWRNLDRVTLKAMALTGLHFVAIDVSVLAIVRTPDVIVAQLHGPEAVAIFSAVGRLPMLMLAVFQAVLLPYWPILAEALHAGNNARLRRTAVRSLWLMLAIGTAGAAVLATLGASFVRVWLGIDNPAIVPLARAASLQSLGMGVLAWFSVVLGAMSMFRAQLALFATTAIVYLTFAPALGNTLGPMGVSLGQAATILCVVTPVSLWLLFSSTQLASKFVALGSES